MARASIYDEWEDPGMSFTEEEIEAYRPVEIAEERCAELLSMARVLERRSQLDVEKPTWCHDAAKRLLDSCTWYLKALELEPINRKEALTLPSPQSGEGKALTKVALEWSSDGLSGLLAGAESLLRLVTTIGRRAEHRTNWRKSDRKQSNRLANCLQQDMNRLERLLQSHG